MSASSSGLRASNCAPGDIRRRRLCLWRQPTGHTVHPTTTRGRLSVLVVVRGTVCQSGCRRRHSLQFGMSPNVQSVPCRRCLRTVFRLLGWGCPLALRLENGIPFAGMKCRPSPSQQVKYHSQMTRPRLPIIPANGIPFSNAQPAPDLHPSKRNTVLNRGLANVLRKREQAHGTIVVDVCSTPRAPRAIALHAHAGADVRL